MPTPSNPATLAPGVVVESWPIQFDRGTWFALAPSCSRATAGSHPHDDAASLAARQGFHADVVHSTSWRMDDGDVVVTYVVVTADALGDDRFPIHLDHRHTDGCDDRHAVLPPTGITPWSVLHHAVHHLALLAITDDAVRAALGGERTAALAPLTPQGAGELRLTT